MSTQQQFITIDDSKQKVLQIMSKRNRALPDAFDSGKKKKPKLVKTKPVINTSLPYIYDPFRLACDVCGCELVWYATNNKHCPKGCVFNMKHSLKDKKKKQTKYYTMMAEWKNFIKRFVPYKNNKEDEGALIAFTRYGIHPFDHTKNKKLLYDACVFEYLEDDQINIITTFINKFNNEYSFK